MANSTMVTVCVVVGFINLAALMVVVILPQWRVNAWVDSQPSTAFVRYLEGLWVRCTAMQNSYFSCDQYGESIIGLPADLNALRALMIVSLLATVVGFVCSLLGMRCISVVEDDSKQKRWILIIGGICHTLSGVLTCLCVSWYAAEVIRQYYNTYYYNQPIKYTLGACLYVGWVSTALSLICGLLMTCCSCFSKPAAADNAYSYKPPVVQEKYGMSPVYPSYPKNGYSNNQGRTSQHSRHHEDRSYQAGSKSSKSSYSYRRDSDARMKSGYV